MEVNKRRAGARRSVTAGSERESRMKSDEVRGGVKVFNAEESAEEGRGGNGGARLKRSTIGVAASSGKRKTWKSKSSEGKNKSPIQVCKGKIEERKDSEEQCKDKEMSVSSSDGIKNSPIPNRKVGASADKLERSPIQSGKVRSEKGAAEVGREGGEGHERSSGQLRKCKSDSAKKNASVSGSNSIQLRRTKSELDRVSDESRNKVDGSEGGCDEKIEVEGGKSDADENCKDFDVCQEKVISSSSDNVDVVKCSSESSVQDGGDSDHVNVDDEADEEGDEEEEEEVEVEVEMEEDNFDVKEISIPESKVVKEPENEKAVVDEPDEKIVVREPENKGVVNNEPEKKKVVNEPESKKVLNEPESKKVVNEPESKKVVNEPEPTRIVSAHMRFHHNRERPVSVPHTVKQSPPIRRHSTIYQNFPKANSIPKAEEYHSFPQTQSKLQSLVDLVMWRDVSRSAFVFGMGTFIIISSSYAKDISVSFISVMSYIGLVYLAVIFLYRSLICRGVIDVEDSNYVLGEEEAIWVLKLILPYLNEFLSKLKALFSGDPGTTIKLAVLLFVLARCGSYITIWKMAKFGFFGVFTVPKICSSYSAQITAYANFWVRRFRDAWDSCSRKKAVALGIFGLVWNLSSVVARIWAVFVLFVAFRYYQQHYLVGVEWVEDEEGCDGAWQEPVGVGVGVGQKQGRTASFVDINKVKKGF